MHYRVTEKIMAIKNQRIELLIKQLLEIIDNALEKSETLKSGLNARSSRFQNRKQSITTIQTDLTELKQSLEEMNKLESISEKSSEFSAFKELIVKLTLGYNSKITNKSILRVFGKDENGLLLANVDLASKNQTILEQITTLFVFAARAILRVIDYISHTLIFIDNSNARHAKTKTYNDVGETPFAQTLTGKTQFFPKPIISFAAAISEMEKISTLLSEEISPQHPFHH